MLRGQGTFLFRSYQRQLVKCDDIEGAQSGTLKKAPNTIRHTNPMNPDYQFPGNKELSEGDANNPYGQKPQAYESPYDKLKKEQEDLKNSMMGKKAEKGKALRKPSNVVEDVAKFYGAPPNAVLHQSVNMEEIKATHKDAEKKGNVDVKKE